MTRPEDTDFQHGSGARGLPDCARERALDWARGEVTLTLPRWALLAGAAAALALALVALD